VAKEAPQAISIHDSLRPDMVYYRDLFVDIAWFMCCIDIICFVILAVAIKIGYLNY
jgi:hypothetical protein